MEVACAPRVTREAWGTGAAGIQTERERDRENAALVLWVHTCISMCTEVRGQCQVSFFNHSYVLSRGFLDS